ASEVCIRVSEVFIFLHLNPATSYRLSEVGSDRVYLPTVSAATYPRLAEDERSPRHLPLLNPKEAH
ncbi:MAG TPA: hypothetical protein V6C85_15480, partial [Allocoleopsis sp.]